MIWATVSSGSCFCWLYRASSSLAAKNIINLISVLTIWWCPCVESSLLLLEEGVCLNQGKSEVVQQEMARVNTDILGTSELKCTGMGEFNSDDHYIYFCRQESLRRNGVAIMVNKRNAVLGCNLKNDRMILFRFQGKPFNITVIEVYVPTSKTEEAEVEQFYEDLQDLLVLTPKKNKSFSP